MAFTLTEREALMVVEQTRPPSLRAYDQIPMLGTDLLRQVKAAAPRLAGKRVAFMGDHDGSSLLLGLLAQRGVVEAPAQMLVLDFDERLLHQITRASRAAGLPTTLQTKLYNAFESLPPPR